LSIIDESIIDMGCGSGILSFLLAKKAKKTCKIIGVDINPNAVLSANINASKLKIDNFKAIEWNIMKHQDYGMFALTSSLPKEYSIIISNPPWIVAKKLDNGIGLEDGVYDEKEQFLNSVLAFTSK
jgi:release factor glutamine methyltransferase